MKSTQTIPIKSANQITRITHALNTTYGPEYNGIAFATLTTNNTPGSQPWIRRDTEPGSAEQRKRNPCLIQLN